MKYGSILLAAVMTLVTAPAFASRIGDDGFVKLERIKGDSQYKNQTQEVKGSWTTRQLKELRSLNTGMSRGQVRDTLNSESVNYSSGWRGNEWQHAYNYMSGFQGNEHHVCVVRARFEKGVVKELAFKHQNTGNIGDTPDVCEVEGPSVKEVIIREVVTTPAKIRQ